jgi:Rha family phage regulatory protein
MSSIVLLDKERLTTTSKIVSDVFGKVHRNVMRDIEQLDCSDEFRALNFEQSEYKTERGKVYKCHNMTKDGFYFLCMGFTGKKAAKWKEAFIGAFNEMEKGLLNVDSEMTRLSNQGKQLKQLGSEWSKFGHDINKQKKAHDKSVLELVDKVQLKLGLNDEN